eukprot:6202791-Pleurochrysis_carterae.AAC.3
MYDLADEHSIDAWTNKRIWQRSIRGRLTAKAHASRNALGKEDETLLRYTAKTYTPIAMHGRDATYDLERTAKDAQKNATAQMTTVGRRRSVLHPPPPSLCGTASHPLNQRSALPCTYWTLRARNGCCPPIINSAWL